MSGGYQPDFLTPYLRAIFETIGIRQVEFLCADGLSRGPEAVAAALAHVQSWIERRLPPDPREHNPYLSGRRDDELAGHR